jgi:hypothetical protein
MVKSIRSRRSRASFSDWDDCSDTIVPRSRSRSRGALSTIFPRSSASRARSTVSHRSGGGSHRGDRRGRERERGDHHRRPRVCEPVRQAAVGAVVGAFLGAAAEYVVGLTRGREYPPRHKRRSVAAAAGMGAISGFLSGRRR